MKKLICLTALFSTVFVISIASGEEESKGTNFSITGDFSNAMATNFEDATIVVQSTALSEDGKPTQIELASTALEDGKFMLEGFVEKATMVHISLTIPDIDQSTTGRAIIEPDSNLKLDFFGPYHSLVATGDGLHAELISSWESDPVYLDASVAYGFYMESIFGRMDREQSEMQAEQEAAEETEVAEEQTEEISVAEEADEEREPSEHAEVLSWASMECADYTVDFVSVLDREYDYDYGLLTQSTMRMSEVMSEKRNAVLNQIVSESEDPTKRLFAMELGAFSGMNQQAEALSVWRQLSTALDEGTVAARVQPTIERLERSNRIQQNDESLVPGVFAPAFSLPDFDGNDVALASILEENEVVMIDFWASWCGPCIAQFPHLKKLYAEYAGKGFEIVGISLDNNQEAWAGAVEEHQPPWINLGEINPDGWGPISQEYGVRFIPHTYVLDDESCIMKKDLQPDELEDFLDARLGS